MMRGKSPLYAVWILLGVMGLFLLFQWFCRDAVP